VRDHLREDVTGSTEGRTRFLSRVAANSLDIVMRDISLGEPARQEESRSLGDLLGVEEDLPKQRWNLVQALRSGSLALDDECLQTHLRNTVANQLAVDQPNYPGLATALSPC
jgi:hypothetical protein